MAFPSFSFFENKKVLLLTHAGADVDAIASAAAFFFSLNKKKASIGVLDHANLNAKTFAKKMGIPFSINPLMNSFDCIVAFDFNDLEMTGSQKNDLKNFGGKIFVFDHHKKTKNPVSIEKNCLINEKAVSTTEIVYGWLKKQGKKINQKTAICIACGIIVDSAGFRVADSNTFKIMSDVFAKSKKSFPELNSFFEVKRDISESIAKLKAAKRIKIFKSFEHLVVSSDVGSFEAIAAMVFVYLGASVSFAGDCEEGKILISARAKNSVVNRTGFDLVKHVFVPLAKKVKGSGGGHPGAAAFNGFGEKIEPVLKECVQLTHGFFQKKFNKKSDLKEYK